MVEGSLDKPFKNPEILEGPQDRPSGTLNPTRFSR
jgi:hypothetical protein